MKKNLLLATLILVLALCVTFVVACNPTSGPGGGDGGNDDVDTLPSYDKEDYVSIFNEYLPTAARYKVFEGQADSVYNENDQRLDITYKDGDTYVGASAIGRSGIKTFKVFKGKTLTYAKIVSVTYIYTYQDFNKINENLDGYYVLNNDVYFDGACAPIGKAPLVRDDNTTYKYDVTGRGSTLAQVGVPFTGTFDGNGHTLYDYSLAYSPTATSRSAYCMGLFEYVGQSGVVKNFQLKRASVKAGHYGAIVCGVNLGQISDVMVHGNCALTVEYAETAGIAVYNGGTLTNVDCYVTTAQSSTGARNLTDVYENGGEKVGCYIGNPYPVEYVVQNDNLTLIEGVALTTQDVTVSVIYSDGSEGIADIIKVDGYNPNGALNTPQTVKLYYGAGADDYVTMQATPIPKSVVGIQLVDGDIKTQYVVNSTQLDLTNVKLTVSYNNGTSQTMQVTSDMIDAGTYNLQKVGSYEVTIEYGGYKCYFVIVVINADSELQSLSIVGQPATTSYPLGGSVTKDDLDGVTLRAQYSDGSALDIEIRLSMLSYNFDSVGASTITVEYGGMSAVINVTVYDFATKLAVTLKGDNRAVSYSAITQPNFNDICLFEVEWASGKREYVTDVVASNYKAGLCREVTFRYQNVQVASEIDFEIWYVITSPSEWAKINDNLAGYYRLGGDITLDATTSAVIGQTPLNLISADDGYEVNIQGSARAGIPFTGKFDGDSHTIFGFTTKYKGAAYEINSYALTPFGYVGQGAEVGNFTLSGASIQCGQAGSFVAALNMGEIRDVTIEEDCYLYVYYGNDVPAVSVVNGGTIQNVTCHVAQYASYKNFGEYGGSGRILSVSKKTLDGATETNCWLVSRDGAGE